MKKYTFLGFITIVLWGSNIGFTRIITENIGAYLACGIEMSFSGIMLILWDIIQKKDIFHAFHLPKTYLIIAGICFLITQMGFYVALNMCTNRAQVLIVSAANYLWPVLSIIFSIPILHRHFKRFYFYLGIVISIIGTIAISISVNDVALEKGVIMAGLPAYFCAFIGAVAWALYTEYSAKYLVKNAEDGTALSWFMLITGVIGLGAGFLSGRQIVVSNEMVMPLIYVVIFPSMLAYLFWDMSIQKGDVNLVNYFSLFTVVLSITFSSFVLKIPIQIDTIFYAFLIAVGALFTRKSLLNN